MKLNVGEEMRKLTKKRGKWETFFGNFGNRSVETRYGTSGQAYGFKTEFPGFACVNLPNFPRIKIALLGNDYRLYRLGVEVVGGSGLETNNESIRRRRRSKIFF